jgi:AAA15 family ATPase/GTPase
MPMIYRLEIENFYSIKEKQVIDLTAHKKVPDIPGRLVEISPDRKDRAPLVVAVFGANASGKSTILRSLAFLSWFIEHSFALQENARLPYTKFQSNQMLASPTKLSLHFSGPSDINDFSGNSPKCEYVYELELATRIGTENDRVVREAIYYWPNSGKRKRVIERLHDGTIKSAKEFELGKWKSSLSIILKQDVSVISTLAQLKHPVAQQYARAANSIRSNILMVKFEDDEAQIQNLYAASPEILAALNKETRRIDLGIEEISVAHFNGRPYLQIKHSGLDQQLGLSNESHGTVHFLKTFPRIHYALQTGGVVVMDELDTSIHPLVLPEILRWFADPVRNPHSAQLWMTCHNVSLLEELIKEEVLFCDKSLEGATEIYSLAEIQDVPRVQNFYRKYLGGTYGAIPKIG